MPETQMSHYKYFGSKIFKDLFDVLFSIERIY